MLLHNQDLCIGHLLAKPFDLRIVKSNESELFEGICKLLVLEKELEIMEGVCAHLTVLEGEDLSLYRHISRKHSFKCIVKYNVNKSYTFCLCSYFDKRVKEFICDDKRTKDQIKLLVQDVP